MPKFNKIREDPQPYGTYMEHIGIKKKRYIYEILIIILEILNK